MTMDNGLYFPFLKVGRSYGKQGTFQLIYSATFATLAAFRNFIVEGEDGNVRVEGRLRVGHTCVEGARCGAGHHVPGSR